MHSKTLPSNTLQDKTLKELRAVAKARGLKGYSKLTKAELLARLAPPAGDDSKTARASKPAAATAPSGTESPRATATSAAGATEPQPSPAPTETPPPAAVAFTATEEWIERAKYASRPNGGGTYEPVADLGEDIDRLPALTEPVVCLLAQKPGILYAYWVLPADDPGEHVDYRLRFGHTANGTLHVLEEIPVSAARGSWYFHVDEHAGNRDVLVQLGFYRDGRFVSARGRSIARLPSVFASTRTDERWWISEAAFTDMYLRGGGFLTPMHRHGWSASVGSPGGAPPPTPTRAAWPGGVSSSSK